MYTDEEVQWLLEEYHINKDIASIATKLGKSPRSIIGKLSRLGVYEKKQYVGKTGERPVTKLEYCARIAQHLDLELEGLEKAPKGTLKEIAERLDYIEEVMRGT